jgi:dATP pyrophosphohydrolase
MPLRHDMIAVYVARPGETKSHEFLQLRRREDDYLGGTWSTVYGMVEPGETAWQAALRELREEAGISPRHIYRVPTARSFYTSFNDTVWIVPAFCVTVARDVPVTLNEEHTAYRWVRRDHVEHSFLWATDRENIAEICRDILSPSSPALPYLLVNTGSTE